MFKLQGEPTFWTEVGISVPGQPGPIPIEVEFVWLSKSALLDLVGNLEGRDDLDLLSDIVRGWKMIDAEYSRDNLARLLDQYPTAAKAMFDTYRAELLQAKEKN